MQNIVAVVPPIVGKNNLGTIAIVVHSPAYDPDALDVEVGYLLTHKSPDHVALPGDRMLTARELPAVDTMATIVHVGPVSQTHGSYGALANWLEANQYRIAGPGREILIQLPAHSLEDEAVVELQFPVTKPASPINFTGEADAA